MSKTRLLALVLIMILICGLLGACGTAGEKEPADTPAETPSTEEPAGEEKQAAEEPEPDIDISEFVEISNYVLGDPPANDMVDKMLEQLNPILKEKINAHMRVEWIEWADYLTKYNLLLASGQEIDMIHASSTWLDFWPNVQKGSFLALDDLIPKYAPKTWAEIPQEDWEQCKYQGKIYCFPENSYTQYVNHGIFYRGDWLKEFGMEPVKNFEEMGEYFKKVKEVYGPQGVIPFDAHNGMSLWEGYIISNTDYVDVRVNTGRHKVLWGKSFEEPFELVAPVFEDLFVEYAKMMKDWDEAGVWRKDVLNFEGDTRANLRAGQSASDQHHSNTYRYLRVEMDELIPGSDLQMFAWCDTRGNLVAEPITHGATAIGRTSKHPERTVMLYELFRQDEEIYRLINYGIEGVSYVINEEGKLDRPEGFDSARDGFSINWWGGRVDKFELRQAWEWEPIWDIWAEYDKIVKKPFPYGRFVLDRPPIEAELSAISEVTNQYGPMIDFGKVDDPEKEVEDYRNKLKAAGFDKVMHEIGNQLAAYKEQIGEWPPASN